MDGGEQVKTDGAFTCSEAWLGLARTGATTFISIELEENAGANYSQRAWTIPRSEQQI